LRDSGGINPKPQGLTLSLCPFCSFRADVRLRLCGANLPPIKTELLPAAHIQARIHIVRGKRVMLDSNPARYYGVGTRDLNKAVSRNRARFPEDFAFQLTLEETQALMFQAGTSKRGRGGRRKPARVFTEQGVAMLASVLRSRQAVIVSVALVRAFAQLREMLSTHRELAAKLAELERKLAGHDHAIRNLFETIRQLLAPPPERPAKEMGFHTRLKKP